MTLTKKALARNLDSMRISVTDGQKAAILKRFGTEPFPYEWSGQDIFTQIENFLGCGEFTKPVRFTPKKTACKSTGGAF